MQLILAIAATVAMGSAAFFNVGANNKLEFNNPFKTTGLLRAEEVVKNTNAIAHIEENLQNHQQQPEATEEPSASPSATPTASPSPSSQVNLSVGVNNNHRFSINGAGNLEDDGNRDQNRERVQSQTSLQIKTHAEMENDLGD